MQDRLPERVEPFSMAAAGRRLSGTLSAKKLKRLAGYLFSTDSELNVELEFDTGEQGMRLVSGRIAGDLLLTCQRCLGSLYFPVDISFRVAMARGLDEAERLPAGVNPLVLEQDTLSVAELIEDEILLILPIVPRHTGTDTANGCAPGSADRIEEKDADSQSPFAVLANLKNRT